MYQSIVSLKSNNASLAQFTQTELLVEEPGKLIESLLTREHCKRTLAFGL